MLNFHEIFSLFVFPERLHCFSKFVLELFITEAANLAINDFLVKHSINRGHFSVWKKFINPDEKFPTFNNSEKHQNLFDSSESRFKIETLFVAAGDFHVHIKYHHVSSLRGRSLNNPDRFALLTLTKSNQIQFNFGYRKPGLGQIT